MKKKWLTYTELYIESISSYLDLEQLLKKQWVTSQYATIKFQICVDVLAVEYWIIPD